MPLRHALLATLLSTPLLLANPIVTENAKPGTDQWLLAASPSPDIEGYASATSVARGETIRFFVRSRDPRFRFEIFRMGWYGGRGGRQMTRAVEVVGGEQPIPAADPATGLIECRWRESFAVKVPVSDWLSGVYLAKLTALPNRGQNYIMFVVRDDRRANLYFQSSVTTHQAYNNWGGKSLYAFNSKGIPANHVSFDRPYARGTGPREFLNAWEYAMVRFLEREGYDVTYGTNIDIHSGDARLFNAAALLSVGHDEYWSWEMREYVERARDRGIHLGFFSANTCYWQIRLEPNTEGRPNRTIVAYKEEAYRSDPFLSDADSTNDTRVTTLWRDDLVGRPEESLIGVMYVESPVDADIVVENTDHWVFDGTTLQDGDRLPGLLGYEVDGIHGYGPAGVEVVRLATSPFITTENESGVANMTVYCAPSGAWVFATGSIQWSWGLDDYASAARGSRVSANAQQITRNVLNRFVDERRPR